MNDLAHWEARLVTAPTADHPAPPLPPPADLAAVLDAVEEAVTVMDAGGTIVHANEAEAHLAGYPSVAAFFAASAEELRNAVALFDERGERITQQALPGRRLLRGETPAPMIVRVRTLATGMETWRRIEAKAIRGEDGVLRYAVVLSRDITARRRAEQGQEQALAEAEAQRARLADLIMRAPASIAYLEGPEHIFRIVNPPYRRYYTDDPTGKPFRIARPELADTGTFALLDRVYATGEPHTGNDVPMRLDRDGSGTVEETYHDVVYQPTWDAEGKVEGILIHSVDVTEQVRARQRAEELLRAARAAEERFRGLFNGTADAVLVTDAEGRYVDANPAMTALVGYTLAELRGMRVGDLSADKDWARNHRAGVLREGVWRGEMELLRKDGVAVPVEGAITALALPQGLFSIATWRDISERRERERQQQEFLAAVAHDLRTPLTSLKGYAALMQRRAAFDPRHMGIIAAQAGRLERLVNDVLEASRLDAHRLELRPTEMELADLVRQCVTEAEEMAQSRAIRMVTPDHSVRGQWDFDRIFQVVQNLLTNAIKYSPEGGEIVVAVEDRESHAHISVTDHGIGIPPDDLPRLFDRFYRATNARAAGGLGLGLYISKGLIEAHGGTMTVETTLGAGSIFSFTLPYAAPSHATRSA